jgi:hypothetical protein
MTPWARAEAENAFGRAHRERRRAALLCKVRTLGRCAGRLAVHELPVTGAGRGGRREIALEDIRGTLEPNRAAHFDAAFRPAAPARCRWLRLWHAAHRGAALPPISVVRVCGGYAIRDGHHRVSVAASRGALTIDAIVATA